MSQTAIGDEWLTARIAMGSKAALNAALSLYGPLVFVMARRLLDNPLDAEAVVEETFLALWDEPKAWDPTSTSLAGHLLCDTRRRCERRRPMGKVIPLAAHTSGRRAHQPVSV
ncbi:MAG: hypothetical protein QOK43_290 [Acidimicrobiaceae bacterium]|jgi:RNA polymerase sigma-70 factor (ECF subfamily)|nr:hypothetical protein [Acidimicrobiaceae bacterium]MDQ1445952.1 hypothetical protein [Acidimicrobiaceae bacterium]